MSRLRGRYASGIYGAENVFEFHFNLIMMWHERKFSSGKHIIRPHEKKFQLNYALIKVKIIKFSAFTSVVVEIFL